MLDLFGNHIVGFPHETAHIIILFVLLYGLQIVILILYLVSRVVISVDKQLVNSHMERLQNSKHKRLVLDEDSLRWTPLVSSQSLMEEEKQTEHEVIISSPARSA